MGKFKFSTGNVHSVDFTQFKSNAVLVQFVSPEERPVGDPKGQNSALKSSAPLFISNRKTLNPLFSELSVIDKRLELSDSQQALLSSQESKLNNIHVLHNVTQVTALAVFDSIK